jgi:hypothetical protein
MEGVKYRLLEIILLIVRSAFGLQPSVAGVSWDITERWPELLSTIEITIGAIL